MPRQIAAATVEEQENRKTMYKMEGRGCRRFKYDGNKNDRQCTYNVTLRRVLATTIAVKLQ